MLYKLLDLNLFFWFLMLIFTEMEDCQLESLPQFMMHKNDGMPLHM